MLLNIYMYWQKVLSNNVSYSYYQAYKMGPWLTLLDPVKGNQGAGKMALVAHWGREQGLK